MLNTILLIDRISSWTAKAFAWCILIMTFGVSYEVFVADLDGRVQRTREAALRELLWAAAALECGAFECLPARLHRTEPHDLAPQRLVSGLCRRNV